MKNIPRPGAIITGSSKSGRNPVTWAGIRSTIMDRITRGIYPPGALIPTEQELAAEFGSARATVNRALTSLAERGVLERRRRVGTKVVLGLPPAPGRAQLPIFRDLIEERGGQFEFSFLGRVDRPPSAEAVERLFRSDPANLREYTTLMGNDGRAVCAERRWLDTTAFPQLTEELMRETTANEWISQNVALSLVERVFSARRAGEVEADQLLRCLPDDAVLVYETTLWVDSRPFSWTQHSFVPDFRLDASSDGAGMGASGTD